MLPLCPQLGVMFLVESNSWNVNVMPNLIRTVKQMLRVLSLVNQLVSDIVLAKPSILFPLSYSMKS